MTSGERRRATLADVEAHAGLAERLPNIDFVMSMGLPEDAANETVDLAQFAAMVKGTRKPIVVSSPYGGESMRVMREMAGLCGRSDSFLCLTMTSPPLMIDDVAVSKTLVVRRARHPARARLRRLGRHDRAGLDRRRRGGVQRRGPRRPHAPPARRAGSAVRLRRRRRGTQHAHHGRGLQRPGGHARPAGDGRPARPGTACPAGRMPDTATASSSTASGASSWRSRRSSGRSRGPRCCTTSATSNRACSRRSRPSCSATPSPATHARS